MSAKRALAFLLLLLAPSTSRSETLSASVEANGFSFSLGPATTIGGITFFFTSFDGSSEFPLVDCLGDDCWVGGEAAPTSPGSLTYRTDYIAQDAFGILEFGALSFSLEAIDSDGNGIPDALERETPGAFSFSGTAVPDYNVFGGRFDSSVSGYVVRSAGSRTGTYSGSFINSRQTAFYAGDFALSGFTGTISYDPLNSTASWSLTDGAARAFTGTSQLNRAGVDSLGVAPFALSDSASGLSVLTQPATLARTGNAFRGRLSLVDGEPFTSWPDYTELVVEIVDPNDPDLDALPGLVDNCPSDPNPAQQDGDADGTGNACDNCGRVSNGRLVTDPGGNVQLDADGDGCGNACDADYDNSGGRGSDDFNFFRTCFLAGVQLGNCILADHDGNGAIGASDFNILRAEFRAATCP